MTRAIVPSPDHISRDILVLRGHRVLLDAHLAALYGVTTKRLNEQVKRNAERFPEAPRPEISTLRFHRARRNSGGQCSEQPQSHRDGDLRRACLSTAARNACL